MHGESGNFHVRNKCARLATAESLFIQLLPPPVRGRSSRALEPLEPRGGAGELLLHAVHDGLVWPTVTRQRGIEFVDRRAMANKVQHVGHFIRAWRSGWRHGDAAVAVIPWTA